MTAKPTENQSQKMATKEKNHSDNDIRHNITDDNINHYDNTNNDYYGNGDVNQNNNKTTAMTITTTIIMKNNDKDDDQKHNDDNGDDDERRRMRAMMILMTITMIRAMKTIKTMTITINREKDKK